jgi:hypothetical protein
MLCGARPGFGSATVQRHQLAHSFRPVPLGAKLISSTGSYEVVLVNGMNRAGFGGGSEP